MKKIIFIKILIKVLSVLTIFLFFSCAGKKTNNLNKNTYHYGVIPVVVSDDFLETLSRKTSFYIYNQKLDLLVNKVYYYYYYYLYHPKVIEALSSGDNKIKNLPIKLQVKDEVIETKIDIEYPEYLKNAFVDCKSRGGIIKIQAKTIYSNNTVDNREYLDRYKVLVSKESKAFRLYPNFVCVRDGIVVSRYVVLPMRKIREISRYATERFDSDYPEHCSKKINIYSLDPLSVGNFLGNKVASIFRSGCPIYPKYCVQKVYKPHNICNGAGTISGIGVKAIYDSVFGKDGFWNCGVKNSPNELKKRAICEILHNCKDIKKFCEVKR